MKMKNKRILAVLLVFMMIFAPAGCKKADKTADAGSAENTANTAGSTEKSSDNNSTPDPTPTTAPTEAPTPTPEPVTADELIESAFCRFEPMAELMATDEEKVRKTIDIPDGVYGLGLDMDFSMDMFGMMTMKMKMRSNGSMNVKDNLAEGSYSNEMTGETSSAFMENEEPEVNTESETKTFYLDNTDGENLVSYYKSDKDDIWYTDKTLLSDMMEDIKQNTGSEAVSGFSDMGIFTDLEEFSKSHTTMQEKLGGYETVTEFTWEEFYAHYAGDFDKMFAGMGEMLNDLVPVSEDDKDMARDLLSSGTGSFKTVMTFDDEKNLNELNLFIKDFAFSYTFKYEDQELPFAFSLSDLTVRFTFDDDSVKTVTIPQDVVDKAVVPEEPIDWDDYEDDDNMWDGDGDINWYDDDDDSVVSWDIYDETSGTENGEPADEDPADGEAVAD